MSLFTFGFYDFIWFYRQWKTFAAATKSASLAASLAALATHSICRINVWPGARTVLIWLYFHTLAKRVEYFCGTHGLAKPKPLGLTIAFLVRSSICTLRSRVSPGHQRDVAAPPHMDSSCSPSEPHE